MGQMGITSTVTEVAYHRDDLYERSRTFWESALQLLTVIVATTLLIWQRSLFSTTFKQYFLLQESGLLRPGWMYLVFRCGLKTLR